MLAMYLIVFGSAAIELWAAIPIGFALGLPAFAICILVALGSILGICIAALLGDKLRNFIMSKKMDSSGKPKGRIYQIWQKYGVVGYGLLAPVLTGAVLGSALGIVLGIERGKLILWLSVGAVLWTIGISVAISLGMIAVSSI